MTLHGYNVIAPLPPAHLAAALSEDSTSLTDSLRMLLGRSVRRRRERRATPRVQVELCCEDLSGPSRHFLTTFDLSTFGVSTRCGASRPIGAELSLKLHLPDDLRRPLEVRAVVVGEHEQSGGMRLAFRSPPEEAVRRIHKYLFAKRGGALAAA